jgi:hypothetical protein
LVAGDFEEIYGEKHWGPQGGSASSHGGEGTTNTTRQEGEHEEETGNIDQRGRWGAVVTCFFIDTVSLEATAFEMLTLYRLETS